MSRHEWGETARSMPWRTRWRLARNNSKGVALPPGLAHLALLRGRMSLTMIGLAQGQRHQRMAYKVLAGLIASGLLLQLVAAAIDGGWRSAWLSIVVSIPLMVVLLSMPWQQRREGRMVRRSIALNEAQELDQGGNPRPT